MKCVPLETAEHFSEDDLELFELQNPDVVLITEWRIRKHLWACVFGTQWFHKSVRGNLLDTLLHNRLYQIIQLTKNNDEATYECFYPFIMLIMNLTHLIPLFNSIYKSTGSIYDLPEQIDLD